MFILRSALTLAFAASLSVLLPSTLAAVEAAADPATKLRYWHPLPKAAKPEVIEADVIAYGSIRMEPVFMVLGQSAATAAVMAIDANSSVQDVPYARLRERLDADKQLLIAPPKKAKAAK